MWTLWSSHIALPFTFLSLANSTPYNPSSNPSLLIPSFSSPASSSSFLNITDAAYNGWPATTWTYNDVPNIIKYEEYGVHVNQTLTKDIVRATLRMQADISKGSTKFHESPIAMREDPLIFHVLPTGEGIVDKREIFGILDQWRVYAGQFGAREILLGEVGTRKPWAPAAVFTIEFSRV